MEALGAEGEWTSLSGVYTAEEADFMALLLSNQISSNGATTLQNFWPDHDHRHQPSSSSSTNYVHFPSSYCSLELSNPNTYTTFSRGSTTSPRTTYNYNNNCSTEMSDQNSQPASIDFFVGDSKTTTNNSNSFLLQRDHCEHGLVVPKSIKRSASSTSLEEHKKVFSGAKRPRSSEDVEGGAKKQGKSRKKPKLVLSIPDRSDASDELGNGFGANNGPSSSGTCCSADESINGGLDLSGGDSPSLSPTGPSDSKGRARRGSATDPQSLYARKRRERINERLRILQNIVPNGTKVDISTMLEEAVQYVKFLQIQIKLLSSDDLWMYAPIAYNGKDLGLDHQLKLSLAKQS